MRGPLGLIRPLPRTEPIRFTAFGDFPPELFRMFDEERYARDFVERGQLRFALLTYYRTLESATRRDLAEGEAYIRIPGPVTTVTMDVRTGDITGRSEAPGVLNYQGSTTNAVYICSFTYPPDGDITQLPKHFGPWAVRVREPQRLAQDITDALFERTQLGERPIVECARVEYTKGTTAARPLTSEERFRLAYAQKDASFSDESEYRLVVIAGSLLRAQEQGLTFHIADLGKPIRYAEVFHVDEA
jgi:hypothetical protein